MKLRGALLGLLCAAAIAAGAGESPTVTAFVDVNVVPMDRDAVLAHGVRAVGLLRKPMGVMHGGYWTSEDAIKKALADIKSAHEAQARALAP